MGRKKLPPSVNVVMDAVAAYNSLDAEKEMSFYSDDYVTEERMAGMKEWHGSMESLNMQPWAVVPVRLQGDDRDLVLVWSVEDRVWKNGSKQTQDLFEVFPVGDDGKINGFSLEHLDSHTGSVVLNRRINLTKNSSSTLVSPMSTKSST